MLAREVRDVDLQTPAGLYLGQATTFVPEPGRISLVLEKIVRGLYWLHTAEELGPVEFHPTFISRFTMWKLPDISEGLNSPTMQIGSAFAYRYGIPYDEPRISLWAMRFFGKAVFVVGTLPTDATDRPRPPKETPQAPLNRE